MIEGKRIEDRTRYDRLSFYLLLSIFLVVVGLFGSFWLVERDRARDLAAQSEEATQRDAQIGCFIANSVTAHRKQAIRFYRKVARRMDLGSIGSRRIQVLDCEDLLDLLGVDLPETDLIEVRAGSVPPRRSARSERSSSEDPQAASQSPQEEKRERRGPKGDDEPGPDPDPSPSPGPGGICLPGIGCLPP